MTCPAFSHLECFDPPISRYTVPALKNMEWKCSLCLNPVREVQKHNVTSFTPQSLARTAASRSLEIRRKFQETTPPKSKKPRTRTSRKEDDDPDDILEEEEEDVDDDDDDDSESDEDVRRRRSSSKRVRHSKSDVYDNEGRRIHFLKGTRIDPEKLIKAVEEKGGYDNVVSQKLWQAIRKQLNLPHTTSSSTQLREVYLAYTRDQ